MLDSVERWAHLHTAQPQMICGPYQGALLMLLCRSISARTAIEIGSFVGYSTICIARGLTDNGILHAFEINEEYEAPIRRHLQLAGVGERVSLHIGDAKVLLTEWYSQFSTKNPASSVDFAFVDAEKRSSRLFYDLLVPMLRPGGLLLVDNVLWGGKVLNPEQHNDLDTRLFLDFNDYVSSDSRVSSIMLPIRDGLTICMKNFS